MIITMCHIVLYCRFIFNVYGQFGQIEYFLKRGKLKGSDTELAVPHKIYYFCKQFLRLYIEFFQFF